MPYIYKSGLQFGVGDINIDVGSEARELTQAQYDALPNSEKNNGTIYFISDGIPTQIVVNDPAPIGSIQAYGGMTAPDGWLICDGSAVSRILYRELFAVIGIYYGAGDNSTTFNLPDLRGRVLTGVGELNNVSYILGEQKEAGLPNITGTWNNYGEGSAHGTMPASLSGAIYGVNSTSPGWGTSTGIDNDNYQLGIDASRSNPIYGNSTTVQPATTVVNYIVKAKDTSVVSGTRSGGGGSVNSTDVPTANYIAEWDENVHMNSADMSSTEINSFLNGLGSIGSNYLQWQTYHPTLTQYNCSGTIGTNDIYLQYAVTGNNVLVSFYGRAGIGSMTRNSSNPGFVFNLPFTPTSAVGSAIGGVVISGGTIRPECTMLHFLTDGTALFRASETMINMANGNFMISGSGFFIIPIA